MTISTSNSAAARENPAPSTHLTKHAKSSALAAVPKRALGDITNLSAAPAAPAPYKHASKLRRATAATTKRPVATSNSAVARRARARALLAAKKAVAAGNTPAAMPRRLDFAAPPAPRDLRSVHDTLMCPPAVLNIDACDAGDELMVGPFATEIYHNFRIAETRFMPDPMYMRSQTDITSKMRAILVDWLVDVHQKFKLQPDTLHLTVNIIDRFLAVKPVARRKLQLVGVTSMLIAAKYEEIYSPEISDFVYISDKAYTKEEILSMEALILNEINFEITVPTAFTFLRRAVKATNAVMSSCAASTVANPVLSSRATSTTGNTGTTTVGNCHHVHLAFYLVELTLQDRDMLHFRPSVKAAAACKLAAALSGAPLPWDATMQFHTGGWSEMDLVDCEALLRTLLDNERDAGATNKLTAVKRKFGQSQYSCVANTVFDQGADLPTFMDMTE